MWVTISIVSIFFSFTEFDKRSRKKFVELYAIIKAELNQMGRNFKEDICFSDFLNKFQTDHLGYITAIRSSIASTRYGRIQTRRIQNSANKTRRKAISAKTKYGE